jgi:hypothetical protein
MLRAVDLLAAASICLQTFVSWLICSIHQLLNLQHSMLNVLFSCRSVQSSTVRMKALREVSVGMAMMSGVASGYYIFEPVVRSAAAQQTAQLNEMAEIAELTGEPIDDVKAQVVAAGFAKSPFNLSSWFSRLHSGNRQG